MDHQEGLDADRPPLFTVNNYAFRSVRMRFHLMSLGCKIWSFVEKGYKIPENLPTNRDELYEYESNAKYLNVILKILSNLVFVKVMQCKETKHDWQKIKLLMKGLPVISQNGTSSSEC